MSAGSLLTVFMDMLLFFVPMKFAFLGIETRHWIDHLVPGFFVWCSFSGDKSMRRTQMLLGPWLFSFQHLPG